MSKNVDLHNADNISILPDMMRRPSLSESQEEVLRILRKSPNRMATLVEMRINHLVSQPGSRLKEAYEMGFNVRKVGTIPKYHFQGPEKSKIFTRAAVWKLDVPEFPRPGFLEEKRQKMLEQSTPGEELPALVATAAIPIQVDLFSPQANDAPNHEEAAI